MRWVVLFALALAGCPTSSSESMDARVYDYTQAHAGDKKSLVYNLIGRWYPMTEIKRLDDDTMTPEEWCAREPAVLEVFLDDVRLTCADGAKFESAIARVDRNDGVIQLVLRATKEAKFKQLTFTEIISNEDDKNRPYATIDGTPCSDKAIKYARFARIEILERQILDGRHCAQIKRK